MGARKKHAAPCFSYTVYSGILGDGRAVDGVGEVWTIVEQCDLGEFLAPAVGMLADVGETRRAEGDVL